MNEVRPEELIHKVVTVDEARAIMVQAGWSQDVIRLIFSGFVPDWPIKVGPYALHVKDGNFKPRMDVGDD
jgi:hypothetical protein